MRYASDRCTCAPLDISVRSRFHPLLDDIVLWNRTAKRTHVQPRAAFLERSRSASSVERSKKFPWIGLCLTPQGSGGPQLGSSRPGVPSYTRVVASRFGQAHCSSASRAQHLSGERFSAGSTRLCRLGAMRSNDSEVPRARFLTCSARTSELEMIGDEHRSRGVSQRGLPAESGLLRDDFT